MRDTDKISTSGYHPSRGKADNRTVARHCPVCATLPLSNSPRKEYCQHSAFQSQVRADRNIRAAQSLLKGLGE